MTSAAYSSGHVPAVSVIVPAHNDEPYIGQCIESILGQTFEDFELIVVNDGSTDNTPSIIEEYAAKDPRVRVIHTGQKSGRGAARNTGIEAARADLIAFQDADDLSVPDRLEIQKRFLDEHPNCGLVANAHMLVDEDGVYVGVKSLRRDGPALAEHMRRYCAMSHCAAMFRTEIVRRVGGYRTGFAQSQDYDMVLRVLERTTLGVVDVPVYKYRQVPCGVSMSRTSAARASLNIAREFARQRAERGVDDYEEYMATGRIPRIHGPEMPSGRARYYYRLARMALDCREYRIMFRYLGRGLREAPLWAPKYAYVLCAAVVHFGMNVTGVLDWFERTFRHR
ncbi:MAG: glycosyltransferase family 2 protein [Planctomycetota bacterium]